MLAIEITRVVPIYPARVFLQWEVTAKNTPVGAGALRMAVYRSESPAGPWDLVSGELNDTFYHVDDLTTPNGVRLTPLDRNWYYYVRVVNGVEEANSFAVDLDEVAQDPLEQREALPTTFRDAHLRKPRQRLGLQRRKMLRDLWLQLHRGGMGWKFAILKIKHFGTRCTNPNCWDPATKTVLLTNCPVCKGTGWVGGYYNPFYTLAQRRPGRIGFVGDQSVSLQKTVQIMFLDFPFLTRDDILVDVQHNERFKVSSVQPTEVKGIRLQQYATVDQLVGTDPVYCIQVDRNGELSVRIDPRWHRHSETS